MPFSTLSTELHIKILEHLYDDCSALSSMSMVSRHFRQVAEPILYREFDFSKITKEQIWQLLATILTRRDLAERVRSIIVPTRWLDNTKSTQIDVLERCFRNIESAMLDMTHNQGIASPAANFADAWLAYKNVSADVFLAIFFTQARNIRRIHLIATSLWELEVCQVFLELPWKLYRHDAAERPLHRLEDLCIEYQRLSVSGPVPVLLMSVPQGTKRLALPGCRVGDLKFHDSNSSSLEDLRLENAIVLHTTLIRCLQSGKLANLRRLNIDRLHDANNKIAQYFNYAELTSALAEFAPMLEVLEARTYKHVGFASAFHHCDFTQLKRLHTLRVDIDHVVFADGWQAPALLDPFELLPPSLQHLEITQFPIKRINRHAIFIKYITKPSGMQFVVETVRNFGTLKTFDLGVCKSDVHERHRNDGIVLSPTAVELVEGLLEEALGKGLVFRIHVVNGHSEPKRYLFGSN